MSEYVWRDPSRQDRVKPIPTRLRLLTRDEFEALSPWQREVRQTMWEQMILWLRADHERRYAMAARREEILAEAGSKIRHPRTGQAKAS